MFLLNRQEQVTILRLNTDHDHLHTTYTPNSVLTIQRSAPVVLVFRQQHILLQLLFKVHGIHGIALCVGKERRKMRGGGVGAKGVNTLTHS